MSGQTEIDSFHFLLCFTCGRSSSWFSLVSSLFNWSYSRLDQRTVPRPVLSPVRARSRRRFLVGVSLFGPAHVWSASVWLRPAPCCWRRACLSAVRAEVTADTGCSVLIAAAVRAPTCTRSRFQTINTSAPPPPLSGSASSCCLDPAARSFTRTNRK